MGESAFVLSSVCVDLNEGRFVCNSLQKLWSHSNITQKRKCEIFNACIVNKVMYSLESLWLRKADKIRLNAFYYYCLRRTARIPPLFVSHVTNKYVFEHTSQVELSALL